MVRGRMAVRRKVRSRSRLSWAALTVAPWCLAGGLLVSMAAEAGQEPAAHRSRMALTDFAVPMPDDLVPSSLATERRRLRPATRTTSCPATSIVPPMTRSPPASIRTRSSRGPSSRPEPASRPTAPGGPTRPWRSRRASRRGSPGRVPWPRLAPRPWPSGRRTMPPRAPVSPPWRSTRPGPTLRNCSLCRAISTSRRGAATRQLSPGRGGLDDPPCSGRLDAHGGPRRLVGIGDARARRWRPDRDRGAAQVLARAARSRHPGRARASASPSIIPTMPP